MKSTLFSKGIYIESLRKIRTFIFIAAALVILYEVSPILIEGIALPEITSQKTVVMDVYTLFSSLSFISTVCAIVFTAILFCPFNKRQYSDFCHSLPYSRGCIFVTKTLAVYTGVLILWILAILAGIGAVSLFPSKLIADYSGFWLVNFYYLSIAVFVISAFEIGISLTGTVLSNITVSGLILFFPRYALLLILTAIRSIVPMINESYSIPVLSPGYNTFVSRYFYIFSSGTYSVDELDASVYTTVVGLIYAVIAFFVFKNRRSETAEQPAPGSKVQAVIRALVACIFTLLGAELLISDSDNTALAVILFIVGIVAYFTYEIITERSFKKLLRALPGLLLVLAINLVCVGMIYGLSAVVSSYEPAKENVDSVKIKAEYPCDTSVYSSLYTAGYSGVSELMSDFEFKDDTTISIVTKALSENRKLWKEGKYSSLERKDTVAKAIAFKEGFITKYRTVIFTPEEYEALQAAIGSNAEYRERFTTVRKPIEGTMYISGNTVEIDKEAQENICKTLQEEINEIGFEKWYAICADGFTPADFEEYEGSENRFLDICYSTVLNPGKDSVIEIDTVVYADIMPKTYTLLLTEAAAGQKNEDFKEAIKLLSDKAKQDAAYTFTDVTVTVNGEAHYYSNTGASYDYDDYYCDSYSEEGISDEATVSSDIIGLMKECVSAKEKIDCKNYAEFYINISAEVNGKYKDITGTFYYPISASFNIADYPSLASGIQE